MALETKTMFVGCKDVYFSCKVGPFNNETYGELLRVQSQLLASNSSCTKKLHHDYRS